MGSEWFLRVGEMQGTWTALEMFGDAGALGAPVVRSFVRV